MANIVPATTNFELRISCRNLSDLDVFSKSDPLAVVYTRYNVAEPWLEVGRTECIMNNLNPDFARPIVLPWHFEANQYLRFLLVDVDDDSTQVEKQDMIGYFETTLSDLVGCHSQGIAHTPLTRHPKNKSSSKNVGTIKIAVEELQENRCEVKFKMALSSVYRERTCGFKSSCSPTVTILRATESGEPVVVYRSEVAKSCNWNSYGWVPEKLPLSVLCNGQTGRTLTFRIYNGTKLIGACDSSVADLSTGCKLRLLSKKRPGKTMGFIDILQWDAVSFFTFYDYLQAGHNISLSVGIDFTQSNGDPRNPSSLHYIGNDPRMPNAYLRAIYAVGGILEHYDTTKCFPAFAFGCAAKLGNIELLSTLALSPPSITVYGVAGLAQAYQQAIVRLPLSGPTYFAPLINITCDEIEHMPERQNNTYHILLIVTDGVINDMTQTKRAIIRACNLPLSLVIVGVGQQDFSQMEELDGDIQPISVDGLVSPRDIVQFVPMRSVEGFADHQSRLASEVLAEIPGQFLEYARLRHLKPNTAARAQ